jgi:signal transduction histidine kinase
MTTMAHPPLRQAAWIVPAICAALLAGGLLAETRTHSGQLTVEILAAVPLSLGFGLVGALIVSQRPRNRLGLLYLGSATAMALSIAVFEYAWYGIVARPDSLPAATAAAWVSAWIWTLGFTPLFTFGLLLYPDARLPSRRWRWAAVLDTVALVFLFLPAAFSSGSLVNHPVDNPFGLAWAGPALRLFDRIAFPLVLAGFAAGVIALVVRWRRAEPASRERRQVALLALAAAVVLLLVVQPDHPGSTPVWGEILSLVAMGLVPAAIGVAILRHRLYDIDVVLNRSLVYGGLTVVITVLYAAMVWALGSPVHDWTGAVAIGLVGAVVLPLRSGLQRLVDRSMYGDRGNPYAALSGLTSRLQAATAPGAALPAVAESIADALRLPYVAVETASGRRAAAGTPRGGPQETVELVHQGQPVGRLVVEGRDRRALGARDVRLLGELARPAGAAVSAAALADALSESRARLVQAREEERRRLRRDLHDGLGPTLAGIGLGLDLVAHEADPDAAARMLAELKQETNAAVDDVRRLVEGLRPPALDEVGLVPAIRQQAERLALRSPGLVVRVDSPAELPPLAAATEVAAYRIAVEAVTNVVRHAGARTCRVEVSANGALQLEVVDDGRGLGSDGPGVGLSAMSERAAEVGGTCDIMASDGHGTRVLARLPLETA